jgi:hypothetical protein
MRLPMQARTRSSTIFALAMTSALLVACAGESTGPSAARAPLSHPFSVVDASKALVGVTDGTYSVTFDPTQDQKFHLGPNSLSIPAGSVCAMDGSSGYGEAYWNEPCASEQDSVTIRVVIRNAASDHPGIEFYPAMRFNPANSVLLSIYAKNASHADAAALSMLYCADGGQCVDESVNDADLETHVDPARDLVFRRIKHFSGYVVWSFTDEGAIDMEGR